MQRFPDLGVRQCRRWAFKRNGWLTLGLCRTGDSVTIDQKHKYGAKGPQAPGTAVEHPQFVRLFGSQRLHERERRTIDRVWIAPDDFHEILPCLERAVLAKLDL